MPWMFNGSQFNGDISKWNVSSVTMMYRMFRNSKFNGDISQWVVPNSCVIAGMFDLCSIPEENKPNWPKMPNDHW
jgi:surface protein